MKVRLACFAFLAMLMANLQAADMDFLQLDSGSTQAVKVGRGTLVHTAQVFGRTAEETLDQIQASIKDSSGSSTDLVKINVYGANQKSIDAARSAIAMRYSKRIPAISYVIGKLADSNAVIAMDAVAITDSQADAVTSERVRIQARSSTLLPGSRVYVSGQAEKGATPAESARLTLESLRKTLVWLRCSLSDVVQVKSFLTPISAVEEVKKEFELAFGAGKVPPLVFVEWESALPIEIELIAAAPASVPGVAPSIRAGDTSRPASGTNSQSIEYLTPPGMTASPIYCRVAKINSPETIYFSGIYSSQPGSGETEVRSVFEQLRSILEKTGSDFKHLAKATYYVSAADASSKLNELRPKYYDAQRPPAASKAAVANVGMPDRTLSIDMIAVPR